MIPSPGTEKRKPSLLNLQADLVWYCGLSRQRTGASTTRPVSAHSTWRGIGVVQCGRCQGKGAPAWWM